MQRDRDRLTTTDLEAARRELEGEPLRDLRYALKRLREWDPPDPKDAVRWAVQEAIVLETGWKVWGDRTPASTHTVDLLGGTVPLRRPPHVLEKGILKWLDALAERGSFRLLNFLGPLRDRLEELEREARETPRPRGGFPPGLTAEKVGSPGWFRDLDLWACLEGRFEGDWAALDVEEYLYRAWEAGYEESMALDALHTFRDKGLVVREDGTEAGGKLTWPPELDTPLRPVAPPPLRWRVWRWGPVPPAGGPVG